MRRLSLLLLCLAIIMPVFALVLIFLPWWAFYLVAIGMIVLQVIQIKRDKGWWA